MTKNYLLGRVGISKLNISDHLLVSLTSSARESDQRLGTPGDGGV